MKKLQVEGGQQMNLSMNELKNDSNIRRNRLVLEKMICNREKESWLNTTSSFIYD